MHRCTIVVEGCKFSFWRKFSERRTWTWSLVWFDSGHQAWYGFMRPCAVCIVQSAMCNLLCDMWYGFTMPWTPSISTLCTSHEIWQRLYEPHQLHFARTPMIPGLDFLTHTTHWTHRGVRLTMSTAREHMRRTSVLLTLEIHTASCPCGVQPYPDRSVATNEPGADSKDTKAAQPRPPSHALSSVSKY